MRSAVTANLLVVVLVTGLLTGAETATTRTVAEAAPAWDGSITRLSPHLRRKMTGVSWRPGCPVHLNELRLLRMPHWGFDGRVKRGALVVRAQQSRRVLRVFRYLYAKRFPIRRMRLIEAYDGSDARSMDANNTSAFNCRKIAGTTRWSEHAYGRAVDINPVQNPYVKGSIVQPEAGRRYLNRRLVRKGMVVRPGPVVRGFINVGWKWGGDWKYSKDYQHFSRTGR